MLIHLQYNISIVIKKDTCINVTVVLSNVILDTQSSNKTSVLHIMMYIIKLIVMVF